MSKIIVSIIITIDKKLDKTLSRENDHRHSKSRKGGGGRVHSVKRGVGSEG